MGLFSYGDFNDIGGQLSRFPLTYLLAALGLAIVNYALRYLRWLYYLRFLKIPAPLGLSALVFLAGLAMSITPGKAGELIKSYLLRDRAGVPVAASGLGVFFCVSRQRPLDAAWMHADAPAFANPLGECSHAQ